MICNIILLVENLCLVHQDESKFEPIAELILWFVILCIFVDAVINTTYVLLNI